MPRVQGRPVPDQMRQRLPKALRVMLAASILMPLLVLAGASWLDHCRLNAEALADVDRLSAVAREHALKVVETNALVLDRLEDSVRGLTWPQIEADGAAIQRVMRQLDEQIAQLTALHLIAPDGRLALISVAYPTPKLDLANRAYFRQLAAGEQEVIFGNPTLGRITGLVGFTMARQRASADGRFDGAVVGSILPDYFQAQWKAMDPSGQATFTLRRTDGQVLATHPRRGASAADDVIGPPAAHEVPGAVRHPGDGGPVIERLGEGLDRLTAFRQVGQHPLVVSVSLSLDRVWATWLRHTAYAAAGCLSAIAAFGSATLLAARRWRSEQAVLAQLRRTAAELHAEINRREAAEAGFRQAQRLEALGRLTGGVAHDFNNLLTAILGTVHLLERHLATALDDKSRRLLGMARDAVNRGARLNASLLAFARRQQLHTTSLDANDLIQGFVPLVQRALGEAVTLTLALDPLLPFCRADAAQLEAALLNLAINARDAMPGGGTVLLTTRPVRLDTMALNDNADAEPGDYVAISFRDDGAGMAPDVRDRAFEPFFTTKPQGKGTGLGLSQVFGFIRQLGGHIAIDSRPDHGTAVTLFLPVATERPAVPAAAPADAMGPDAVTQTGRVTVLIAEDDARVREVAAETLRDAGYRVVAVPDGQSALALLRRGQDCDVLFSDVVMPGGLNGIHLAQAARRLRPNLPVLLATGYSGAVPDAGDHGFEVLAKPYDQAALARRIAALAMAVVPAGHAVAVVPAGHAVAVVPAGHAVTSVPDGHAVTSVPAGHAMADAAASGGA